MTKPTPGSPGEQMGQVKAQEGQARQRSASMYDLALWSFLDQFEDAIEIRSRG